MAASLDLEAGPRKHDGLALSHKPLTVSWRNVTISTKKGKIILKDMSGEVRPNELTAIMGPSGAGKTTLLSVLSGFRKGTHDGQVFFNGTERMERNLSCYVPQDTRLLEYLTVKESITFAAELKVPKFVSRKEKELLVRNVIDSLGLRQAQDTRACELSSGERKRLCIGQEIVNNPSLVFLDEPTSGLDSSSCLQCVRLLKSLSRDGRTVVCTIHQPSARVFEIFDQIYLVAEGQCVYRGQTKHLTRFFAEHDLVCPEFHNPADFAMEVLLGQHGSWNSRLKEAIDERMAEEVKGLSARSLTLPGSTTDAAFDLGANQRKHAPNDKSSEYTNSSAEKSRGCPTSFSNQFKVLTKRNFVYTVRHPMLTRIQLVTYIVTAVFNGVLVYGAGNDAGRMIDNAALVFFTAMIHIFLSLNCTALTFPLERSVVTREHLNNWYSSKAYFLAKTITQLPSAVVFPIVHCAIVYWMTAQPNDAKRFCMFAASMILVTLISQAQSVIVAAIFDTQTAVFLTTPSVLPFCMLCGFLVRFEGMFSFLRWLSHASYVRYIFQGAIYSLYGMNRKHMHCSKDLCLTPRHLLKYFSISESEIYLFYGVPLGFLLTFEIIGYYTIMYKMSTAVTR